MAIEPIDLTPDDDEAVGRSSALPAGFRLERTGAPVTPAAPLPDGFRLERRRTPAAALPKAGDAPLTRSRTWGEVAKDTGLGIVQGAANLVGGGVTLAEMASPINQILTGAQGLGVGPGPSTMGADFSAWANEGINAYLSEPLRRKKQELAETEGFVASAKKVITDPALAGQFIAEQVPNLFTLGSGTALTAARAGTSALARGATREVAEAAAQKAGQRFVTAGGTAMEVGDATNSAIAQAMALPEEVWAENPEYQAMLANGSDPDAAKRTLAVRAAAVSGAVTAPLALAGAKITAPLETTLFRRAVQPGGSAGLLSAEGAKRTAAAVGKEAAEETIQEGGNQFGVNVGTRTIDPNQALFEGVPEAAGTGAAVGGLLGGGMNIAGTLASRGQPAAEPTADPNTPPPAGPLPLLGAEPITVGPDGTATTPGQADRAARAAEAFQRNRENLGVTPDIEDAQARDPRFTPVPFPGAAPGTLAAAANALAQTGAAPSLPSLPAPDAPVVPEAPAPQGKAADIRAYIRGQLDRAQRAPDARRLAAAFGITPDAAAEVRREVIAARKEEAQAEATRKRLAKENANADTATGPAAAQPELPGVATGGALRADAAGDAVPDDSAGRAGDPAPSGAAGELVDQTANPVENELNAFLAKDRAELASVEQALADNRDPETGAALTDARRDELAARRTNLQTLIDGSTAALGDRASPAPGQTTTAATPPSKVDSARPLFVRMGGQVYPVDSLDDAKAKFTAFRERSNAGASQLPPVVLVDDQGKVLGRFAYNGRLLDNSMNRDITEADLVPVASEAAAGARKFDITNVPNSVFNGDTAYALQNIFWEESAENPTVELSAVGMTADETAALEAAGLATGGIMSADQFAAYDAERSERLKDRKRYQPFDAAPAAQASEADPEKGKGKGAKKAPDKKAADPKQPESRYTRPKGWEKDLPKARAVAKAMGLPHKGRSLEDLVKAVAAADQQKAIEASQKEVGKNAAGETILQDYRGVRTVVRADGARNTESVRLTPAGGFAGAATPRPAEYLTAEEAAQAPAAESTAPEHSAVRPEDQGVSVEELKEIAAAFREHIDSGADAEVTHIFDAPRKDEIVRLADKVKVYHKDHGWMSVAEAKALIEKWEDNAVKQGQDSLAGRNDNSDKVVLSLFDLTGSWSLPWEQAGYQVFRFDIQDGGTYEDPETGEERKVGDVNNMSVEFFGDLFGDFEGKDVYAILAACPCTDFAVSGARHFAAKDADGRTVASVRLVEKTLAAIEYFKPAVWALENPVGRIESLTGLPPWRLSFDPNHLGDPYTKKTLIWGRFNADLPIAPVEPIEGSKMHKKFGGKSLATKNARSATPEGFAYGFFQANNAIDNPLLAVSWKFDRLDKDLIAAALDKGATPAQIDEAVREFYYTELDDEAANRALAYIGANGFPADQSWRFWEQFKDPNATVELMPDLYRDPAARLEAAAAEAATSPENDLPEPTEAQKQAGNYKKGHVSLNGLDITIENPAGTRRRPEWPELKAHYGYLKRTEGADGDHVDLFMSENAADAALPVFIIDQRNADGTFDEHKVMLGWPDEKAARKAYLSNYTKGWKGLGAITAMSLDQFKTWLRDHDTTQPIVPPGKGKKRAGAKREVEAEAFKALVAARTDTAEGVKAWLDEQLAAAGPDAARTAALEAARETVTGPKFLASLKSKVKAARAKDQRTAHRDPAVYADALNYAQTSDDSIDTDARRAAFKAGWDHMLAGKTKSTLSGEESAARQAGYAAARQWAQTSVGRAWYSGKRAKKLENTGATLRRWFDKGRKQADSIEDGGKLLDHLTKITARSTLFPTEPPAEGATPGLARFRDTIRGVLPTFAELLKERSGGRFYGYSAKDYRDGYVRMMSTPEGRAKAIGLANEYADALAMLTDTIAEAKSAQEAVDALRSALPAAMPALEESEEAGALYHALRKIAVWGTDLRKSLITFYRPGTWTDQVAHYKHNVRIKAILEDETKGLETKPSATPLKRPRLDKIERGGLKDHRKGKDVTPQKVKDTFGLADVGFGKWVNAKADQDHLNYAYDAFMDLATVLGIEPKHIGLGGTLHLTVGALGHGKHAAHYSPNQPHPDGRRVPVINVTNTKGDGTVAHEWGHALDYHLRLGANRSGAQNPAVQSLVSRLSNRPPSRQKMIDEILPRFFSGTSYMTNLGRGASGLANARAGLSYYLGRGGGKTDFLKAALDLDGISKVTANAYWSNEREMFARAFEAFVYDKLAAAGQRSDYLVSQWVAEGFATKPAYRGTPYPLGPERQHFARLFEAFIKNLGPSEQKGLDLDYVEAQKALHDIKDEGVATPDMEQELPQLYEDWKAQQAARTAARQAQVEAQAAEARRAAEAEAEARAEAIRRELAAALEQEPGPTDGPLTEDELDALFDEAAAELSESTQEEPEAPAAGEPALPEDDTAQAAQEAEKATAAHLTAEAAKLGVKGVGEAMAGLAKLFGAGKIQSFPGGFDEDAYRQAKPHFEAALKAFTEAGRTLKDLFKLLIQTFGDGIKPYAIQFAKENGLGRQLGGNTEEATDVADSAVAGSPRDGESRVEGADAGAAREAAEGVDAAGLRDDARRGDAGSDAQPVAAPEGQGERDPGRAPAGRKGRAERGDRAGARGNAVDRGPARRNYRAPDGSLTREGGWKATAQRNADIIILAKELERTKRLATPAEQAMLAKYVGFGSGEVANNLFPTRAGKTAAAYNPELLSDPGWQSIGRALRGALTDAELDAIMASTQYAHYTSETVTRAVWSALQRFGFAGGKVFEPGMGHGNFPMTAPDAVHGNLNYTGLERDPLTAMIGRQLLQGSLVLTADYTKQKIPNDAFDAAVGNPPFAPTSVTADPDYRRYRFLLHDYFFAKTLDKVRPGGLMAFVTSAGTMNKGSERARRYMAERADLLGAVRLPNTAFLDNAGTEVTTDILFFRKRAPGETPGGAAWMGMGEVEVTNADGQREKVLVNEYFVANPDMVLGKHAMTGTMYRKGQYTVEPIEGADLAEQLAAAIARLPQDVYVDNAAQTAADMDAKAFERDLDPANRKERGIYVKDGMLMRTVQGAGRPLAAEEDLKPSDTAWLADYVKLRDLYKLALKAQREDGDWKAALKKVRQAYDAFVKKHGPLTAFTESKRVTKDEDGEEKVTITRRYKNNRLLNMDVESALVRALEREDEGGNIVPGPALTERAIAPPAPPRIETVTDALAVSLNTRGRLDPAHVAELAGVPEAQVLDQLGDLVYRDPVAGWMMADEYLSGDVVTKLEEAEAAAKTDPEAYGRNVAALTRVQPKPLTPADITVHLGQAWVPVDVVNRFATEVLDVDPTVTYDPVTNAWSAGEAGRRTKGGRASEQGSEWGHRYRRPGEILDAVLNNRKIVVTVPGENAEGRKTSVVDPKATTAVNEIAQKMRERFSKWVWEDADRAQRLTDLYNSLRNRTVERTFDGSHINPPGLALKYQSLHAHQKRAIWRQVQTGTTYLAHAVGAGKTLEMVIGAMEQKRLGLISKPMFTVPNHMLGQFAAEFLDAYPAANIMVADEEAFSKARRTQFIAAATANAPDAIIISHSALRLLRLQPETLAAVTDELAAELDAAIAAAEKDSDARIKRKQLQRQREALEQRIAGKTDQEKRDDVVTFEEIGVDFLYVDEAHEFRKLDFVSNRGDIKGINPAGSARALDLFAKVRYLAQQRPGRSHVFASGTPITNTMGELYTVLKYMDLEGMTRAKLHHFDAWAAEFGEVVGDFERNAAGVWERVERFSKFNNLPELMRLVRERMDVLTSEQLGELVKRPDLTGGRPNTVVVEASEELEAFMHGELDRRIKAARAWKPSQAEPHNPDPLLAIISDARLAVIDMRFVDPSLPNNPKSKLNVMIDNIIARHKEFADLVLVDPKTGEPLKGKGGTQIVFSPIGFGDAVAASRGFDTRAWVNKRLREAGIPTDQVAWMGDYDTARKRQAVFKEMRAGKKRILIGSPANMGTGVNVQNRLRYLHFLSPPWFPSDVEQPHGRILRQGNLNPEVGIDWYVTEGTYDSTGWGMVARKGKFIEQAMRGDPTLRTIEDISEVSQYAMASALASGDDRAIRLAELEGQVGRLKNLQSDFERGRHEARRERGLAETRLKRVRDDITAAEGALKVIDGDYLKADAFAFTLANGKAVQGEGRGEQAVALNRHIAKITPTARELAAAKNRMIDQPLGKLAGRYEVTLRAYSGWDDTVEIDLFVQVGDYRKSILTDLVKHSDIPLDQAGALGWTTRMMNAVNRVSLDLSELKSEAEQLERKVTTLTKRQSAPWPEERDLFEKSAELARLQQEMAADEEARAAAREAARNPAPRAEDAPTTEGRAPLFSQADPAGEREAFDAAVRALRALSYGEGIFRYPASESTDFPTLVREVATGFKAELKGTANTSFEEEGFEFLDDDEDGTVPAQKWEITAADGSSAYVYMEEGGQKRMYLDASQLTSGAGRGSAIYAALFNYAHNTGRVFIGDPNGLSEEALLRRTELMLSAALKHKSTRFMAPHPRQETPDVRWAHPLRWTPGDDAANLRALVETSYNHALRFVPGLANGDLEVRFDVGDKPRVFRGGEALPQPELRRLGDAAGSAFRNYPRAPGQEPRAAAFGGATVARAVLVDSVVRGARSGRGAGLLAGIARWFAAGGLNRAGDLANTFYSQADRPAAAGGATARVQGWVDGLVKGWRSDAPRVVVVADPEGFPAWAKADGSYRTAEGLYDERSQTIYLAASALPKRADVVRVLRHEVVGHFGIEAITGPALWDEITATVAKMRANPKHAALFAEIDRRYKGVNAAVGVREAVAVMAEKGMRNSVVDRLKAAIRKFLRALGLDVGMTEADLLAHIATAARYVRGGTRPRAAAPPAAAAAASQRDMAEQVGTPAFKRWFGKSVVKDKAGNPVVMYHATLANFDTFRPGTNDLGIHVGNLKQARDVAARKQPNGKWLARHAQRSYSPEYDDRTAGESIMPVYVRAENPLRMDDVFGERPSLVAAALVNTGVLTKGDLLKVSDVQDAGDVAGAYAELVRLLEAKGYDSIVYANRKEGTVGGFRNAPSGDSYIVFRPEQLKSAIGNSGAFDPGNPNITLSNRAGPFYSALLESVTRAQGAPRRGDAKAWKGWLDGAQRRGEFRQSERDWLGLDVWLSEQDDEVTREQLVAYVRANQVQVQDVVLGGNATLDHAVSSELNLWLGEEDIDPELTESEEGWNSIAARLRSEAKKADDDGYNGDADDFRRLADEAVRLGKALASGRVAPPVRYESFQLAGGQNYRELLLTLPAPNATSNRLTEGDIEDLNETLKRGGYDPLDEDQLEVARAGGVELVRMLEDMRDRVGIPIPDEVIYPDAAAAPTIETMTREQLAGWYQQEVGYSPLDDEPDMDTEALRTLARSYALQAQMEGVETAPAFTQGTFYSAHWDSPNVLAHVRFNEREDDEGNRVLFIEEIQSDWHQAGRKRGYLGAPVPRLAVDAEREIGRWAVRDSAGNTLATIWDYELGADHDASDAIALVNERSRAETVSQRVADAPFKATDEWAMLAFKRMVRWAAEQGFDRIAWVPGDVAADRFDLSKHVDKVSWTRANASDGRKLVVLQPKGHDTIEFRVTPQGAVETIGGIHVEAERFAGKALDEVVGKDIAERILADEKHGSLEGAGLKLGSKGMAGFYDKILPAAVNKWAKKFGAKVNQARIATASQFAQIFDPATAKTIQRGNVWQVWVDGRLHGGNFESKAEADAYVANGGGTNVHALDLTEAMRDAALQGLPLFSQADPATVVKAVDQQAAGMPDGVFAKLRKAWKGLTPRNIRDNTRGGWLGALTMRHLGELGKDDGLDHVVEYSRRVQQMSADRNAMQEAVNKVADAWEAYQRKNRQEADELAGIMHDSTIDGVDPSSDYQPLMFKADKRGPKEPVTDEAVNRRLAAIEADMKKATTKAQRDRLTAETNRIADLHSRERNRATAYPKLAVRFGRLSDAGRQLYRDVKKAYEDQSDALEEALVARIEGLTEDGKTRAAFVTQIRERFEDARLQGPYFPLARFGKFWVSAEKDGEPIFTMYETAQAWRDGMEGLRADGYVVKGAGRQVDQDRTAGTVSSGFMADLHQLLETAGVDAKTQDDVHQLFLRSLPDLSMRKHFIHRKKTAGYSNDALRAFAGNMFHGSFQIARLLHTHELDRELQAMQGEVKALSKEDPEKAARAAALLSEMNKRHEWVMNPKDSKLVSTLNGLGFAWYLGVTPAAALVNLTQTAIVSFPVLAARFGHAKAFNVLSATMGRAVRSVRGDIAAGLPKDEQDAIKAWNRDGTIDKTAAHSLAGLSEVDTRAYSTAHRRVMTAISALFHKAEVVNREATALAAYRLARSEGMPFAEAVRYGADIVTESHFDYSNANRARWMQSNAAKVLLMFRQYSLNMTWFLWRNLYVGLKGESPEVRKQARTKLMGVLGMTSVFAGSLGLPLTSVMFGLANAAHAAFGDDDEPWDAETAYRNFMADMLGPEFARILTDGPVNALTGADLASRVSLNNLWLRDPDRELEGKAMANYLLEQAAGPMFGGMLVNTLRGMQQVGDGHTWRGVETMMPKAVKDGLRGIRYASEGVNTLRGDPIVPELSLPETLLQLAGFSPASVRSRYDANNAAKNYEQAVLARREALTGAYAMALRNGDTELARETMAKITRFNAKHPEVAITAKTIRTSLANRFRYSARAEDGIVLNPNLAAKAKEQARFSAGD